MSTLKVNNLNNVAGDTAVSLSGGSLVATDVKTTSINSGPIGQYRNRIINGGMDIDQRNAGAAVTLNNSNSYISDRWECFAQGGSGTGTATVQRVADAPPGFAYSLKYTVTNAKSPATSDDFEVGQRIEGQNVMDLAYGTASAKTTTLSFWVKSSLTGTFSASLRTFGSSGIRSYIFTYTINSANTWQYVTITAPGDTGQSFYTDNSNGYQITFDLGSGSSSQTSTLNSWQNGNFLRSTSSVNLISTLNATYQITGVQFELGTTATPFERRAIGQELLLCERYYYRYVSPASNNLVGAWGGYYSTTALRVWTPLPVQMRTSPTLTIESNLYDRVGNGSQTSTSNTNIFVSDRYVSWDGIGMSSGVFGQPAGYCGNFNVTAEL
jgi:hypothetical protein